MNLCAYLVLDLRAHGQSIQNLGCHIRSATYFFTRRLSTIIPSSGLTCRELNTSTVYVSFIAFTLKRTIQPAQVVEALNDFDTPRYLLTNTHETLQLLAEVNRSNLKYQYDIYHMQRMEGNLLPTIAEHLDLIGHIQIADAPGRGEPGTGEIDYAYLLRLHPLELWCAGELARAPEASFDTLWANSAEPRRLCSAWLLDCSRASTYAAPGVCANPAAMARRVWTGAGSRPARVNARRVPATTTRFRGRVSAV